MSTGQRPVINPPTVGVMAETEAPPGFHTRYRQLGPLLGGEMLGATVYELDPGERNGPYHYELGNEECLLVLDGTRRCATRMGVTCSRSATWSCSPKARTAPTS